MVPAKAGGVNRHTTWCTNPVFAVSQHKLVSGWGLQKRRSAPSYTGPRGLGKTLTFLRFSLHNLLFFRAAVSVFIGPCCPALVICIHVLVFIVVLRLAHLQYESLLFRPPRVSSVSLSVCLASDLENYARYARNFVTLMRNPGRRARIRRHILHRK